MKKKLVVCLAILTSALLLGCVGTYVVLIKDFDITDVSADLQTAYANVSLLVVEKSPVSTEMDHITFSLYCIDRVHNNTEVLIWTGNYSIHTPLGDETEIVVPMELNVPSEAIRTVGYNLLLCGNVTLKISGEMSVKEAGIPTTVHVEHITTIKPYIHPLLLPVLGSAPPIYSYNCSPPPES